MTEKLSMGTRVVVVGVNGSIGRFFSEKIAMEGCDVIGIDIVNKEKENERFKVIVQIDDIAHPNEITFKALMLADIVIFTVAENVIVKAFPIILPYLKQDCLIVETLSVKNSFSKLLENYHVAQQVLGINPMFSGDLDPKNRPIVTVIYKEGHLCAIFLNFLKKWQLRTVSMGFSEHDRTMAILQALTHAIIFTFGKTLNILNFSTTAIEFLAPPPFQILLSLLARMSHNHPDVYWEIQAKNPYAQDVRMNLKKIMTELDNTILENDRSKFHFELERMKLNLIDPNPFFLDMSRQTFEFINVLFNQTQTKENSEATLLDFRRQIDDIDDSIIDLIGRRFYIVRQVASTKKKKNISVMQWDRVDQVKKRCRTRGQRHKICDGFIENLYQLIIDEACHIENELTENE